MENINTNIVSSYLIKHLDILFSHFSFFYCCIVFLCWLFQTKRKKKKKKKTEQLLISPQVVLDWLDSTHSFTTSFVSFLLEMFHVFSIYFIQFPLLFLLLIVELFPSTYVWYSTTAIWRNCCNFWKKNIYKPNSTIPSIASLASSTAHGLVVTCNYIACWRCWRAVKNGEKHLHLVSE